VHAETLVSCGALLWAFDLKRKMGSDDTPLPIDTDACTPYLISMPVVHPVEFAVRTEKRSQLIMDNWHASLEEQRAERQQK
jgi:hypothetical protein